MATASEHAKIVLSAILPNRHDLLDTALRQLTPEHFPDRVQRSIFTMLERYYDTTNAVMPLKYLDDLLRKRADPAQTQMYTEAYGLFEETHVDDSDFVWSVEQLRDLAAEKATGESLTEAMDILRNGKTLPTGEVLRGHEEARLHLLEAFSSIDKELTLQEAPEGNMRNEGEEMWKDYLSRKDSKNHNGINFGVASLDRKVGGMQPGELVIAAGYSSDGKSSFVVQAAWSAAVEQKKNVVFFTTETIREQTRRKLLSRHSKLEKFGLVDGINSYDLKSGNILAPANESKLQEVINDFTKNPEYGQLYIAQVPRNATITSLEQRLYRIQRGFNIDLVVMDYLALLSPDRKRNSVREELVDVMKESKKLATTFDGGRGIPLMSPWQVTREAREEAEKVGMYSSRALSETAEATNSADLIISLLAPTDNTSRKTEITMQILKNRDGETASGIMVEVDYATSFFRARGDVLGSAMNNTNGGFSTLYED